MKTAQENLTQGSLSTGSIPDEPKSKRSRLDASGNVCGKCGNLNHFSEDCPMAPPLVHDPIKVAIAPAAEKPTSLALTAFFGSIVESEKMKPEDVVTLLGRVKKNTEAEPENKTAINTRHVINPTIPLLENGIPRGKQQAVVLLALLINGADHCGMIRRLKEAVSPALKEAVVSTNEAEDSVVTARFEKFLDTLAPPGSTAREFIQQAPLQNMYMVTGIEGKISVERVNVLKYLEQEGMLLISNFFQGARFGS